MSAIFCQYLSGGTIGCSRRNCRIQSPNYPGLYPRNVTCHYRIREKNVPPDKHPLIAIKQSNYHYRESSPKFDNDDKILRLENGLFEQLDDVKSLAIN
ncbi:hypothetical protein YQE_06933, partial [Dendroctonus ponderosae]